jgi:hypothetical protein
MLTLARACSRIPNVDLQSDRSSTARELGQGAVQRALQVVAGEILQFGLQQAPLVTFRADLGTAVHRPVMLITDLKKRRSNLRCAPARPSKRSFVSRDDQSRYRERRQA